MIINTLFANETHVYTGGYDAKVKRWSIQADSIELDAEVDIGCCVNTICGGDNGTIYVGGADGAVRELLFE